MPPLFTIYTRKLEHSWPLIRTEPLTFAIE